MRQCGWVRRGKGEGGAAAVGGSVGIRTQVYPSIAWLKLE